MKIRLLSIFALTVSGLFSGCCFKEQLPVAGNSIQAMIERDETRTSVTAGQLLLVIPKPSSWP